MDHPLLSEALKEAYASAYTEVEVIDAIHLWDESGTNELFVCSGNIPRSLDVSTDPGMEIPREHQPYPFKLSRQPGISEGGAVSAVIAVENVNGAVATFLNTARASSSSAITLALRTYLSNSNKPQNPRPLVLELTGAEVSLSGVTLTASTPDIVNKVFPNAYYAYTTYPGLRG